MKRVYNNMLDRHSLSHDAEGLRIYNNILHIKRNLHKLDRTRVSRWIRRDAKEYKYRCVLATLGHFHVFDKQSGDKVHFTDLMPNLKGSRPSTKLADSEKIHFTDLMG